MDGSNQIDLRLAIESRFNTLLQLTGAVRALIVAGPPGIGKSFGVEAELKKKGRKISVVKSGLSPIGLYIKLWETRDENFTLVIDDSDDILTKREGIDLLKAAFDTNKPRRVGWEKQNTSLAKMGIPKQFEYDGHIIFITNLDLQKGNSKSRQRDFDTIISRVNYLDLEMNSLEAKLMRCQIGMEGGMLSDLPIAERGLLFEYLTKYGAYFSEVSLRTLDKLAEVKALFSNWETISASTLMDEPPAEAYQHFEAEGTGAVLISANQSDEFENAALVETAVEKEVELIEIEICGNTHLVPKEKMDLVHADQEEYVRRITLIDNFFLEKSYLERSKKLSKKDRSGENGKPSIAPNRYKKTTDLGQADAEKLYDFVLKFVPELEKLDANMLRRMVKLFKLSGDNWQQGILALFINKGVSIDVQKRS